MSATVIRQRPEGRPGQPKPACQILILHEDFAAYTQAVEVCRRLMEQFAAELDFNIKCWNFIELTEPNCARHAAKTAAVADILLLSLRTAELPPVFERWLENFFILRSAPDGALALVVNNSENRATSLATVLARLEQMAGLLGMDFVPLLSRETADLDLIVPSETQPVLASPLYLSEQPQFDHWGLNE